MSVVFVNDDCYCSYKLLIIGDSNVGKSSILSRFADHTFIESYNTTIGVDYRIVKINHEGKNIRLFIWDASGQERFLNITTNYYKGSDGIIIVYDVCNGNSFINVKEWLNKIKTFGNENVKKILVGNKSDMNNERVITKEIGQEFADSLGIEFIETSTKDSKNINEIFFNITNQLYLSSISK